jgi:membrane associated rhomboid family serine protease
VSAEPLAAGLARSLVLEQGFEPLAQALPSLAPEAALFDHCLMLWQGRGLVVLALWAGPAAPGLLPHRSAQLARGLRGLEERLPGRVALGLVQVLESPADKPALAELAACRSGNFLSKTLASALALWPGGHAAPLRWEAWPAPKALQLALARPAADEAAVEAALSKRRAEDDSERRWLRPWRRPWATWACAGLCLAESLAAYLLEPSLARPYSAVPGLLGAVHLMPPEAMASLMLGALNRERVLAFGEAWRLLTCIFVHFGLWHLAANTVSLLSLGAFYERLAGWRRFLAVFLLGGLAGSLLSLANPPVIDLGPGATTLGLSGGASGGIVALAGALLALRWRRPNGFPRGLARRLFRGLWPSLAFIFALGLALQFGSAGLKLDNWGHLGGLLAGLSMGLFWPLRGRVSLRA